jgi:hypothetical protein
MRLVTRLILTVALVLGVGLLGCTSTTDGDGGGGGGGGGAHGLGWAMDIADPVRDSELPSGELFWILNDNITDGGEIDDTGVWVFLYADRDVLLADEFVGVYVFYDGSTIFYDEDDLEGQGYDPSIWDGLDDIPGYRDAEPWVTAADEALADNGDPEWAQRVLNVFSRTDEDFPGTDNLALFMYIDEGHMPVAIIYVDADTDDVLEVSIF